MKKQLVMMALAIAIPMSVFARSQARTHQPSGATSHGNQTHSMTSHAQMSRTHSMTQMGKAHQMRGSGMSNGPMNGTQDTGSGNMGKGTQGQMNRNGSAMDGGNSMGMGQGQNGTPQQP